MNAFAIPVPHKAEKKRVKLKMAVQGPSGSGKTWAALSLATNIWSGGKICLVDTENESASLYADRFEFDTIPLHPPFHTARYEACIDAAIAGGYDVLIIDSITPQWDGEGGILRRKEELDQRPGSNSYTNWAAFTPEHTRFKEKIQQAPIHIITTMRSKQDYVLQQNDKGKSKPVKIGMAPIQREGFDYEFSLVFDVQMDHKAIADKNRTGLFGTDVLDLSDPSVSQQLRAWLDSGVIIAPNPVAVMPSPVVQKAAPPAAPSATPFHLEAGNLRCTPVNVQKRLSKKEEEFLAVKVNGKVEGKDMLFCFHAHLFDPLLGSVNSESQLVIDVSKGGFSNIVDVLSVGKTNYRDGKPYTEQLEITDDDIPF